MQCLCDCFARTFVEQKCSACLKFLQSICDNFATRAVILRTLVKGLQQFLDSLENGISHAREIERK